MRCLMLLLRQAWPRPHSTSPHSPPSAPPAGLANGTAFVAYSRILLHLKTLNRLRFKVLVCDCYNMKKDVVTVVVTQYNALACFAMQISIVD